MDGSYRGKKFIPLKDLADNALEICRKKFVFKKKKKLINNTFTHTQNVLITLKLKQIN